MAIDIQMNLGGFIIGYNSNLHGKFRPVYIESCVCVVKDAVYVIKV